MSLKTCWLFANLVFAGCSGGGLGSSGGSGEPDQGAVQTDVQGDAEQTDRGDEDTRTDVLDAVEAPDGADLDRRDGAGDVPDSRDVADQQDSDTPDGNVVAGRRAMIAIHADPSTPSPSRHWDPFQSMVSSATDHGHQLTILMSSDWVSVVMPDGCPVAITDGSKLATVRQWVLDGHQLGYHHHTCAHFNPDGFTDAPGMAGTCTEGSVATSYQSVADLAQCLVDAGGVDSQLASVHIAAQGPDNPVGDAGNTYRDYEWQASNTQATGNVEVNPVPGRSDQFLTQPTCHVYGDGINQFDVAELGHSQVNVGSFVCSQKEHSFATLEAEIDTLLSPAFDDIEAYIGVVFHAREYLETRLRNADRDREGNDCSPDAFANDREYLDAMFQLFEDKGVEVVAAREILGTVSCGD